MNEPAIVFICSLLKDIVATPNAPGVTRARAFLIKRKPPAAGARAITPATRKSPRSSLVSIGTPAAAATKRTRIIAVSQTTRNKRYYDLDVIAPPPTALLASLQRSQILIP